MTTDRKPMIKLAELWERESKSGNTYFSGFLNGASLLMFRGEEITRDNGAVVQTWNLLVQEREPRPQQRQDQRDAPTRGQRTWDRTRERHTARDRAQAAGAALLEQAGRQAEPSDGRPFDDWPDDAERELMGEP